MKLQEKTLELNITHELLNLADSWYWFLTDIPLYKYWRPRHRLPFLPFPRSTAGGFHITTEGKSDPTGTEGGGFDVRIKSGLGGHLLFIQYKLGEFTNTSPDPKSIFSNLPHDHFNFKINGTKTNQHFLLRELSDGIGKDKENAVIYAFPLIRDMQEVEKHGGKLIRRTKFISVSDIDNQAVLNAVTIQQNKEHNFRVCNVDMNRCEVNFFYFFYSGKDRTPDVVADAIALRFEKILSSSLQYLAQNFDNYELDRGYVVDGLQNSFRQYLRFLLHYFEVNPFQLISTTKFSIVGLSFLFEEEFRAYENNERDLEIIFATFNALGIFSEYLNDPILVPESKEIRFKDVPQYQPNFFVPLNNGYEIKFSSEHAQDDIEKISYLLI